MSFLPDDIKRSATGPSLAFKFALGDKGEVQGYGSIFGNVDSYGERVVAGAFAKTLQSHASLGTMPVMLWQHRTDQPVGRWTAMQEDGIGLRVVGQFNLATTSGRDAFEHVKAGDVEGLSIGYRVIRQQPNGEVTDLLELELLETSIVSVPANPRARITGVKCENIADVERLLREGGLPRAAASKIAAGGWPALSGDNLDVKQFADRMASATAEIRKLKDIFK